MQGLYDFCGKCNTAYDAAVSDDDWVVSSTLQPLLGGQRSHGGHNNPAGARGTSEGHHPRETSCDLSLTRHGWLVGMGQAQTWRTACTTHTNWIPEIDKRIKKVSRVRTGNRQAHEPRTRRRVVDGRGWNSEATCVLCAGAHMRLTCD